MSNLPNPDQGIKVTAVNHVSTLESLTLLNKGTTAMFL